MASKYADSVAQSTSPAVGTVITGRGKVVRNDTTRFGLRRLVIGQRGAYPDLETWCESVRGASLLGYMYEERMVEGTLTLYLWLFWKEERHESI